MAVSGGVGRVETKATCGVRTVLIITHVRSPRRVDSMKQTGFLLVCVNRCWFGIGLFFGFVLLGFEGLVLELVTGLGPSYIYKFQFGEKKKIRAQDLIFRSRNF